MNILQHFVFQSHNHKGGPQYRHPNHSYTYLISHPIKSLEVYAYFHYIHTSKLFQGLKFTFLLCDISILLKKGVVESQKLEYHFENFLLIYHFYTF